MAERLLEANNRSLWKSADQSQLDFLKGIVIQTEKNIEENLFTEMKKLMLLVAGMIFIVPACTNLDEELYSDLAAENFFTTEEENIAALGQAYSSMTHWGNHFNIWTANELSSDELVIPTRGGDWYDGGILLQLHQHMMQ